MPKEDFYGGLTLTEQLSKFSDHHYDQRNRHISAFERQMLDTARTRVAAPASESARSPIKIVLLAGGSVVLLGAAAPGLRDFRGRLGKKLKQAMGGEGHPVTQASEDTYDACQDEA